MAVTLPKLRLPRAAAVDQDITPGRRTVVVYDFPEPQSLRLPYVLYREGSDLTAFTLAGADEQTENVHLLPTGLWALKSYQQAGLFERNEVGAAIIRMGGPGAVTVTPAGSFRVSPELSTREHPMWRKPTELTGIAWDPNVATTGDHFIMRGVTALGDWTESLPYGEGADTPPPLGGTIELVPGSSLRATGDPQPLVTGIPGVQRVALGDTTHEANAGYCIRFSVPTHFAGSPDCFAVFYFGGATPTLDRQGNPVGIAGFAATAGSRAPRDLAPSQPGGGSHAVSLHGNGDMLIWEYLSGQGMPQGWINVWKWMYNAADTIQRGMHKLIIDPMRDGRHNLFVTSQPEAHTTSPVAGPRALPIHVPLTGAAYTPNPNVVGYSRKQNATGPGVVKVDHRPDVRMYYQVSRLYYPPGRLTDHPFVATFKLPDSLGPDDVISLKVFKDEPPGTAIVPWMKDADTHARLADAPPPPDTPASPDVLYFTPHADQQAYYVGFDFIPSADKFRTPYLKGYTVELNGIRIDFPDDLSWTGTTPRGVSITSADLDPTHESARLDIADASNSLERLRIKTRVPVQVRVYYGPGTDDYSILFQGETALVHADKRGRAGRSWPDPSWRNLDVACVGMASRVADRLAIGGNFPFALFDWDTGQSTVSGGQPSKITTVIDTLLNVLGYPDDMRDVPDLPVRMFQTAGGGGSDFILQPTANVLEFIIHLARTYLGAYLVYDANRGARGQWRLMLPPEPGPANFSPAWAFTTAPPPAGSGLLPYQIPVGGGTTAYGENKTFIRRLKSWVAPPEGNYLICTSTGELMPAHHGQNITTVVLFNPNSFNMPGLTTADPNGPDYLGRMVPLVYFEPAMGVAGPGLATTARRLYQQACVAQKWIEFDAPLVLLQGDGDRPRPLRLYDAITVDDVQQGVTLSCFVRSVTINYKSDRAQMMTVQCLAPADVNTGVVRSI